MVRVCYRIWTIISVSISKFSGVQIMMLRSMSVETCPGSTAAMQESPTPIKPAPIARSDSLIVADNTGEKNIVCCVACMLSQRQITNELLAVLIIHMTKCICRKN